MSEDDLPASSDVKLPFGNPLAPLAALAALTPAPPTPPPALPDLPAYTQPLDTDALNAPGGQLYWRERGAAQEALSDELKYLTVRELALVAAREGLLDPNWRNQGLAKALAAVEAGRSTHDVWVWQKIKHQTREMWEPNAVAEAAEAGMPVSWKTALCTWRAQLLAVKAVRQLVDPQAVSRWAGFNLVHAWMGDRRNEQWEAVLNRHKGPWPRTVLDYDGHWSESMHAHVLLQELDGIQLSYEVGLAAGGDAIDWRGRHKQRIQHWRMVGERERGLVHLDVMSPDSCLYRLPGAWLVPGKA
jgi:hypothetical protein